MNISTYESQIKSLEAGGGGSGTGGGNINFNSITPIVLTTEEVEQGTIRYYIHKTDMDRINENRPIVLVLSNVTDDASDSSILYLNSLNIYEETLDGWNYKPLDMENSPIHYIKMRGPGEYVLMIGGASDEATGVYDSATDSYIFTVVLM